MKNPIYVVVAIAAFSVATAAIAHSGVKNAKVMARMDSMSVISQNLKVIGGMVQGKTDFDAAAARNALDDISRQASLITELFEPEETDPKSEALPVIWTSWADFTTKADALEKAAKDVDAANVNALGQGLRAIGGTCKSCHSIYRM